MYMFFICVAVGGRGSKLRKSILKRQALHQEILNFILYTRTVIFTDATIALSRSTNYSFQPIVNNGKSTCFCKISIYNVF